MCIYCTYRSKIAPLKHMVVFFGICSTRFRLGCISRQYKPSWLKVSMAKWRQQIIHNPLVVTSFDDGVIRNLRMIQLSPFFLLIKSFQQLQPPFGPSMDSLCHPCITGTHLSYTFLCLSLKFPPPPGVRYTTGIKQNCLRNYWILGSSDFFAGGSRGWNRFQRPPLNDCRTSSLGVLDHC